MGSYSKKNERKGKMSEYRIDLLNSIGFTSNAYNNSWEECFLLEYKAKNGNCIVPRNLDILGRWVDKQRIM